MSEAISGGRAERREEIKLVLEYSKMLASIVGVMTIIFVGLQFRQANKIADETTYQRMTTEWRDHLKTFVEKPDLRAYFEEGKPLAPDDPNKQTVLALVDIRLDVSDAILSYAHFRGLVGTTHGWRNTFARAFGSSPILCQRLHETRNNYDLIIPIADKACQVSR